MSPVQEEFEEAYWTREVHDVKKFCSNVMYIPAEIVEKCGLAGMSEITLNDVDNGYPYECNVKKRPKKNETYLYGEWFDYVRAAELKVGDKVHFVIYYPPVLDIMCKLRISEKMEGRVDQAVRGEENSVNQMAVGKAVTTDNSVYV
ncbi:uncharacterized protein LOC131636083 [Vicia villosa]|uniref:uncharacterized protein LOC131636083 n=1 Tax=Vicia villosa TaxID=3911 RepID=UPI00273BFEF3|nr:uncharacterized protein LOC131636083 [Vicia villosa]